MHVHPVRRNAFRRISRSAGRALAVFIGCGVMLPGVLDAAGPVPHGDTPPSPLSIDGGFTRETLLEFDAPEPAPFAAVPTVSVAETDRPTRSTAAARHRRQAKRHRPATQNRNPVVVVKAAPRRNPAESFVYWWNGWVIRTFHTKTGTVLLGTIGAKT